MKLNRLGFTLVELLVVVSVILISVGIAGELIISVIRSYNKTKVLNEIEQNGNYLLAKIAYDLKSAKSVVSFDTTSWKTFTITDSNGTQIIYTIARVDSSGASCTSSCTGTVTRQYGGGSIDPMTNYDFVEGVDVDYNTSFFTRTSTSPDPTTVRLQFTIKQGPDSLNSLSKSLQASTTFDTSVVMRGVPF